MFADKFRRACALAAFALGTAATPAAHADPVVNISGFYIGSQQFGLSFGGSPNAGGFLGTLDGDPFVFWCVELDQYFTFGNNYNYQMSLPNTPVFGLLGSLFTEAYDEALDDTTHSAAFQLAVWEIVYDSQNLNLGGGSFYVTNNYGHATTVALAQQWLDGLANTPDNYDVYFLSNASHQNFITGRELPEPPALALVGIALMAGWWFTRRARGAQRG